MATRVASLYAEIGADTSKLKRGLAESKTGLQQLKNQTEQANRPFSNLTNSMTQMAVAAGVVTAGVFAMKKAFDFAEAGAELRFVEQRFDRLSATIGTTANALERDLKRAARGTISEMELLARANDLVALGLAKTHDEAVRLVRVAAGLNMNMNQLVLTLTNQTTMRFDTLGVAVDGFDEKLDKLKATGMSTNDAFKEAFLQQAEEQLLKVGEAADSAVAPFLRLKAAVADLTNEFKKGLSSLDPYIGRLAGFIAATNAMKAAVREGTITQTEANNMLVKLLFTSFDAADAEALLTEKYKGSAAALMDAAEASEQRRIAMSKGTAATIEAGIALDEFKSRMSDLNLAIQDPLGKLKEQFQQSNDSMIEDAARLRDAIADLEGKPLTDRGRAELRELQRELGNTKEAIMENARAHEHETKVALFGMLSQRVAREELTGAQRMAAITMLEDLAQAWGIAGDITVQAISGMDKAMGLLATGNVKAAQQEILNIGRAALAVQGDYFIRFHVQVFQETRFTSPGKKTQMGQKIAQQQQQSIEDQINNAFPQGTFSGLKGTGGLVDKGKTPKVKQAKKTAAEIALELARAFSNIGDIAADAIREQTIEPLRAQIEQIDKLMSAGHLDITARERSAELEQQRADAVAKVAEAEKQILEFQKRQQQLRLLEQQLQLLQLAKEHKLNLKEILGGAKLGIDADMNLVLAAMTKALDEIIKKTQDKLEIGSPSKLFMRYGKSIPQGLAGGVIAGIRDVAMARDEMLGMVLPGGSIVGPSKSDAVPQRQGMSPVTINVYPSEGMDEQDLARRTAEVFKRRMR